MLKDANQLPVTLVPLGSSLARAGRLEDAHVILDQVVRDGVVVVPGTRPRKKSTVRMIGDRRIRALHAVSDAPYMIV